MQQALEHIDEGAASSSIVPTTFDLQGEVQGPPFSVGLASNSDRNEKREKRKREKEDEVVGKAGSRQKNYMMRHCFYQRGSCSLVPIERD